MSSPRANIVTEKDDRRRTLFVGDVHGCAKELSILLGKAQPSRLILLGDVFTKGPDPGGVWNIIQQWDAESVLGNQDAYLIRADQDAQRKISAKIPSEAIEWLQQRPLFIHGEGWKAVHAGIDPFGMETTKHTAMYIRRWPNDKSMHNPFWWQLYQGEDLIIYGHDAKRKVQDHRPRTLGLDSGCVYGGKLTGYLLEEDRLISVASTAVHCPIVDKEKGRR